MKSTIQDIFIVIQKDIQTLLQKVSSKISITLDMWISCANISFLCEEINEQLCTIFEAFDITTKILCATTNRGSNSYCCLAHLLNLIVIAGLAPIKLSIEYV
ncbi:23988_t:CDS:2 [Gigaspora margarita]|uniref:23988_t:CDS:1 n=1 Tax=Gigaspora margarita TaxID=4874 RepID=A0ABN7VWJ9_GIGMA|nr:23988_t:CDS:2 [Gigaspora margarita]